MVVTVDSVNDRELRRTGPARKRTPWLFAEISVLEIATGLSVTATSNRMPHPVPLVAWRVQPETAVGEEETAASKRKADPVLVSDVESALLVAVIGDDDTEPMNSTASSVARNVHSLKATGLSVTPSL